MNVLPLIWEKSPRLIWGKKIECYRIRPKMTWHIKRTALFLSIILPSISPTTLLICHHILLWCQRELLNENEKKSSRSDNHFTPLLKNDKSILTKHGRLGVLYRTNPAFPVCNTQIQYFPPDFMLIHMFQQTEMRVSWTIQ